MWTDPELVFAPDEKDETWATGPDQRTEVYNMSVYLHAAGFIGLPTMFRLTKRIPKSEVTAGQSPDDGPIDVQLVASADGRTWQRTEPRVNVIPRGSPGSFDAGAILGVSSTCVHVGDKTWVYYTGLTTTHSGPMPPKRISIGRAERRRHGFVSLDAAGKGRVETKPRQLSVPTVIVNADASLGEVHVTLLEADGCPIPGSNVLRADDTRWLAFTVAPTNRPVRVVLELNNARLYSVSSGDEGKTWTDPTLIGDAGDEGAWYVMNDRPIQTRGGNFDVCIYGGTSGGVAAAVQVVRMGKSVVLLEPGRHLGGMTSGFEVARSRIRQNSGRCGGRRPARDRPNSWEFGYFRSKCRNFEDLGRAQRRGHRRSPQRRWHRAGVVSPR